MQNYLSIRHRTFTFAQIRVVDFVCKSSKKKSFSKFRAKGNDVPYILASAFFDKRSLDQILFKLKVKNLTT